MSCSSDRTPTSIAEAHAHHQACYHDVSFQVFEGGDISIAFSGPLLIMLLTTTLRKTALRVPRLERNSPLARRRAPKRTNPEPSRRAPDTFPSHPTAFHRGPKNRNLTPLGRPLIAIDKRIHEPINPAYYELGALRAQPTTRRLRQGFRTGCRHIIFLWRQHR